MYFNDLFLKIRPFWRNTYSIYDIAINKTYSYELMKDYEKIYDLVESNRDVYSEWDSMMHFVMYKTLTIYSIEKFYKHIFIVNIDDIPITLFEEAYAENLKGEGNEWYFERYKGLK